MKEEEYVTYNSSREIIIRFDKIFGRDDISRLNNFKINRRSYYNFLPLIVSDINIIINQYNNFAYKILKLRVKMIKNGLKYDCNAFHKDLKNMFVNDKKLTNCISNYVENEYKLNLDEASKGKNINIELQVTDELNKIYLKSSMLMRLLIPIICVYNSRDVATVESIIYTTFSNIIVKFDGEKNNALNKLFRIISSRVYQTKYSDIVIWNYQKNMSKDPLIIAKQYYKTIIKNIFPKINHNTSVIAYLDVVVKQKLKYLFTFNYPISYRPLRIETTDDDDLSEQEKMEINLLRNDQGIRIINDCSIRQEINNIEKKYNKTEKEIFDEMNYLELNSFHLHFLRMYYYTKFKLSANKNEIKILLYGMIKNFESLDFQILPKLFKCNVVTNVRKSNNRKKLVEKIVNSSKYDKIIKDYYQPVISIFNKNNPILSLMTIKNYKFIDKNKNEIEIPTEVLSEEILDFILLL